MQVAGSDAARAKAKGIAEERVAGDAVLPVIRIS